MSSNGWNCQVCSYRHRFPAPRCVMCDALRVTREEMRDFVLGKTLKRNNNKEEADHNAAEQQQHVPQVAVQQPVTRPNSSGNQCSVRNPYTKTKPQQGEASSTSQQQRPAAPVQPVRRPSTSESLSTASAIGTSQWPQHKGNQQQQAHISGQKSNSNASTQRQWPQHKGNQQQQQEQFPRPTSTATQSLHSVRNNSASRPGTPAQLSNRPSLPSHQNDFAGKSRPVSQNTHGPSAAVQPPVSNQSLPQSQKAPPTFGKAPQNRSVSQNHTASTVATTHHTVSASNQHVAKLLQHQGAAGIPQQAQKNPGATGMPHSQKNPFTIAAYKPVPPSYVPGPVPLDPETAGVWIYPVNKDYPVRQYQLEISETAVLYNTLVSLPTGLGKTLIAAVVLYNFYRWFPEGKVVFLAPTLPLVNQQVKACYNIMGIPASDTAVLTGKVGVNERKRHWSERRVFFATPQTVQKDIESGRCPPRSVVCLVLDEAHKATGEYAYTKVVDHIHAAGGRFRVLGLSATPGTSIKAIQQVVETLKISKIEARLEDDENVKKYIHDRHFEVVKVKQTSTVTTIERLFNNVLTPLLDKLRECTGSNRLQGSNATVTGWCLIQAREAYQKSGNYKSFNILYFIAAQQFVQMRSDLRNHGVGVVRQKLSRIETDCRTGRYARLLHKENFEQLWKHVMEASKDPNDANHSKEESAEDAKLNNPKLQKLDDILQGHFKRAEGEGKSSRAIVFSQWRDSVEEIVRVLSASAPRLRPRHFVGQGKTTGTRGKNKQQQLETSNTAASLAGMKQKEQQQVIRDFQDGKFNVLVCTCIGEEGLDIGEVDLIVNFDTLRSPIRMIQRVGRTGRKRDGRVVCLVSEGQEQKTYDESKNREKTIGRALKNPAGFNLLRNDPMFPQNPLLQQTEMSMHATFHLSQVGGHERPDRTRTISSKMEPTVDNNRWKLTEEQELTRLNLFGYVNMSLATHGEGSPCAFPNTLRRILLRARSRTRSTQADVETQKEKPLGVTGAIIREMERSWGGTCSDRSKARVGSSMLRARCDDNDGATVNDKQRFAMLFPMEKVPRLDDEDCPIIRAASNDTNRDRDLDSMGFGPELDPHRVVDFHEAGDPPERQDTNEKTEADAHEASALTRVEQSSKSNDDTVPTEIVFSTEAEPDAAVANGGEFHLPTPPESSDSSSSEDEDAIEVQEHPRSRDNGFIARGDGGEGLPVSRDSIIENDGARDCLSPQQVCKNQHSISGLHPTEDCNGASRSIVEETKRSYPTESNNDEKRKVTVRTAGPGDCPEERADEQCADSHLICLPTQDDSSSDESSVEVAETDAARGRNTDRKSQEEAESRREVNAGTNDKDPSTKIESAWEKDYNVSNHASGTGETVRAAKVDKPFSMCDSAVGSKATNFVDKTAKAISNATDANAVLEYAGSRVQQNNNNEIASFSKRASSDTQYLELSESNAHGCAERIKMISSPCSDEDEADDTIVPVNKPNGEKRRRPVLMSQDTAGQRDRRATSSGEPNCTEEGLTNTPSQTCVAAGNAEDGSYVESRNGEGKRRIQRLGGHVEMPTPEGERVQLVDTPMYSQRKSQAIICETIAQDSVDDVVCSVCHSGHSPETDPIVLCDGPENDYSCKIAVHLSCYDITEDLEGVENWRCDPCDEEHKRRVDNQNRSASSLETICCICSVNGGALRRYEQLWAHPVCRKWSTNAVPLACEYCGSNGTIPCAADGCDRVAHPYCAANGKTHWSIVQVNAENDDDGPLRLMFCPKDRATARGLLKEGGMEGTFDTEPHNRIFFLERSLSSQMKRKSSDERDELEDTPGCVAGTKRKRLRKKARFDELERVGKLNGNTDKLAPLYETSTFLDKVSDDKCDRKELKRQRMAKRIEERKRAMRGCKFIDNEADIDTDEDVDGDCAEDSDALRIEEEEEMSHASFINDTSQLGYTQDDLARIEEEETDEVTALHRHLDIETQRRNMFATPILNRRMGKYPPGSNPHGWGEPTPASAPSSQKGLGNMHFIRSVLEHHRLGGRAEEIEELYHKVAEECAESPTEENRQEPRPSVVVMQHVESDSEASTPAANEVATTKGTRVF